MGVENTQAHTECHRQSPGKAQGNKPTAVLGSARVESCD